jgi:hypothetical protein
LRLGLALLVVFEEVALPAQEERSQWITGVP